MRILMLTQYFQPEPIFKGLPLAKALQQRGHEVQVYTGFPNYPEGKLYPGYRMRLVTKEIMDGIPVTRFALYPSHSDSALGRVANFISFACSAAILGAFQRFKPDVIYVYNLITLGLATRFLRWRHQCAVVLDVQDLWPESVLSSGMLRSRVFLSLLKYWCLYEYRQPDRLIVLSPGFKQHLSALGVSKTKINVVYNWCEEIPVSLSPTQAEDLRVRSNMSGNFNILFAGTMGKVQALDTVIRAAALVQDQLPNVLFTFIGGGVEVNRLKALAAGMTNVQFLPKCNPAKALELISVSDAVLVHLKREPLFEITIPSKTQAYLYAGKPILMGVQGDAANLVQQSQSGIVFDPENTDSLISAVLTIFKASAEKRSQMGNNGLLFYDKYLSFRQGLEHIEANLVEATNSL